MEVTRIVDLPPKLYEVAEYNLVELDFVNAFTKIQDAPSNGSGVTATAPERVDDYY
jgi:hypothetical protein